MAKTKASPPKKAKKSTTAKGAAAAPRRSPRKAVQSAKRLAAVEDIVEESKRRSPKQKNATAAKASTKSASKKIAVSKVTKPTAKKATSTVAKTKAPPSPKRGRPKKVATSTSGKASTRAPSPSRISSRTRSKTPPQSAEDQLDVRAPNGDGVWTDSPKKRSPSKPSSKKAAPKSTSIRKAASQKITKASTTGVRKSIELLEPNDRSRASSPARRASVSPVRGRSRTATSPKVRANSNASNTGSTRAPSRSPARRTSKTAKTALALSRAASLSPTKDKVESPRRGRSSRSRSPLKSAATNLKKPQKGRSRSPAQASANSPGRRRGSSRSKSPTKSLQNALLSTTEQSTRSRSKSPSKAASRKPSETSEVGVIPPPILSPKQRGRPRAPSVGRRPSPLQIAKTRTPQSPAKPSPNLVRKSRSASPQKQNKPAPTTRRRSDPSPARGRRRSASPSKTQTHRDKSPQKAAFAKRFKSDDEYGRGLQGIEDMAYSQDQGGVDPWKADFPFISAHDRKLAVQKGRERANLQSSLRRLGGPSGHQIRKPSKTQANHDDVSDELSDPDELTTSPKVSRRNAIASQSGLSGRAGPSPARRRSSANSQLSPKHSPSKRRSSASKSPSRAIVDTQGHRPGEPSAKGRGIIESVTNPRTISGTNRSNPFFETMPAQEVWHRRMPPFLPFGETPYMEREMSRQISEDLAKGAADKAEKTQTYLGKAMGSFSSMFSAKKSEPAATQRQEHKSPWDLPEVNAREVSSAMNRIAKLISGETLPASPKRKASDELSHSPIKRARRRSHGSEAKMSGALQ